MFTIPILPTLYKKLTAQDESVDAKHGRLLQRSLVKKPYLKTHNPRKSIYKSRLVNDP